ncbi:MAG TPA: long-chain-acyl-CoA synthetase [Xanthobacteraceae bacterium]|nr:long-chain-acyl-CoA synthetase [Xanthobacteraceae bacterium]
MLPAEVGVMGFIQNIRDDITFLRGAWRALRLTTPIARNPTRVFPGVIEELAEKFGDAPALISDREQLTYRGLAAQANRYARWALSQQIEKGDTVCLLMLNRPEYMAVWIGITRIGGVVSLLNTNLVGPSLAHCIDIVQPKLIIVANELAQSLASATPFLKSRAQVWCYGNSTNHPRIDTAVAGLSGAPLSAAERRPLHIDDRALYIYTSGTTGLPKAANLNHYRIMLAAHGFAGVMNTTARDRMYDCLPMYHTTGGIVATGALLLSGGSVFVREKFSVRDFWDDVVRHDCTIFQYIGELCRYLVHAPANPNETRHHLRLACGNGLRPELWEPFKKRFRIPQILEFYGATEGNVNIFNFEGKPGAVGRIPWFVAHRFPTAIVKFDVEREQPVRDARGFCIRCAPNEVGEVIGKIINKPSKPASRFEGYASADESEQKILRNVFKPGDAWFRTGDLMRQDERGYFYFVDRIGDTFRWKGENVSTSEVAAVITSFPGIRDANVYGVHVPGREGRAGMAAIVCESGAQLDLAGLHAHLAAHLPEYARPLFLRIQSEIDVTSTFKQKKIDLVRQGFDPASCREPLYFNDPQRRTFVPLDAMLCQQIMNGLVRI